MPRLAACAARLSAASAATFALASLVVSEVAPMPWTAEGAPGSAEDEAIGGGASALMSAAVPVEFSEPASVDSTFLSWRLRLPDELLSKVESISTDEAAAVDWHVCAGGAAESGGHAAETGTDIFFSRDHIRLHASAPTSSAEATPAPGGDD